MGGELQAIDRSAADSLIGWWLDAGVDTAVGESPRDWLGRQKSRPEGVPATAAPTEKPADLAAFQAWLSTAPFRPLVSSHDHAARSHGGAGALYVRLRRHSPRAP